VLGALNNKGFRLASPLSLSLITNDAGSTDVFRVGSRVIEEGGNKILCYGVDALNVSLLYIIIDGCAGSTITTGFSFFKVVFLGVIALTYIALP
jgi:hypothetical protein